MKKRAFQIYVLRQLHAKRNNDRVLEQIFLETPADDFPTIITTIAGPFACNQVLLDFFNKEKSEGKQFFNKLTSLEIHFDSEINIL